jgi:hypothetical protein
MVALASPCSGMVLDWTLVSSVSSMLMFTSVDDSPAGLPSEKRAPIPITTSAACITRDFTNASPPLILAIGPPPQSVNTT